MTQLTTEWEPTSLHRLRDGFYLLVARATNGPRWRYTVTPVEYTQRGASLPSIRMGYKAVQFAQARGYMRSRERAMKAAEVACDGLLKALAAERKKKRVASVTLNDL